MVKLIRLAREKFKTRKNLFDLIIGEEGSNCPNYYEAIYCDEDCELCIGIINNYPNMDLDPQVDVFGKKLIVGNNRHLTVINTLTKKSKEYPVFPVFYKFFIYDERIIVMSEMLVFCLLNEIVVWRRDDFQDMIEFVGLENDDIILATYNDKKKHRINIITGESRLSL